MSFVQWFVIAALFLLSSAAQLPAPQIYNNEVVALMTIKSELNDIHNILYNWFLDADNPCYWVGIQCSKDGRTSSLSLNNHSLSGTLSPAIGNLTGLRYLVLHNNSISGPIPISIGKITILVSLDLSNNQFTGSILSSLGDLKFLNSLKLNNNSLTGVLPDSIGSMRGLDILDLSFNNLSGPLPNISASVFNVNGNPLICGVSGDKCPSIQQEAPPPAGNRKSRKQHIVVIVSSVAAAIVLVIIVIGVLLWWKRLHNQHANVVLDGHLNKYTFKQLSAATNRFSSDNLVGEGASSKVYRGQLIDGTEVAVKKLTNIIAGQSQFQNEIKVLSQANHQNVIGIIGYCSTKTEKIVVYPFMPNGSVDSKLRVADRNMDWSRRRTIALSTAHGLLFLHEECDDIIIHRDLKAANVLLTENYEAVIADYGLARLLGHSNSQINTGVCGTIGYVCPDYISNGVASEKTDVFAFGIFLVHLITGKRPTSLPTDNVHSWVDEQIKLKNLAMVVDENLGANYNCDELEKLIEVALQCTEEQPSARPKMSRVVQMLEVDELRNISEAIRESDVAESSIMPSYRNIDAGEKSTTQEEERLSGPR